MLTWLLDNVETFVERLLIVAIQIPWIVTGGPVAADDRDHCPPEHEAISSATAANGLGAPPSCLAPLDEGNGAQGDSNSLGTRSASGSEIEWRHWSDVIDSDDQDGIARGGRPDGSSSQQEPPPEPDEPAEVPGADASRLTNPAAHASKAQRWQWWTGDRWDAVLPTDDGWRLYTDLAGDMHPAAVVDERAAARVDTLFHDGTLWVARGHTSAPRISRYLLDGGPYVAVETDVALPSELAAAHGDVSPLILFRSSNGRLWVASNNGSNVVVAVSEDDGDTWASADVVSSSAAGVVMLAQSGDTVVLISTESDGGGRAVRTIDQDARGITSDEWSTEKLPGLPGVTSDDHGMAVSVDGHVYAVSKTTGSSDVQPLLYLLHRTPAGQWSQVELRSGPDRGETRPHIVASHSTLYVTYRRHERPSEAQLLTIPRHSLDVPSPETLLAEGHRIDSVVPPRDVSSRSGLLWLFHDRASDTIWRLWQPPILETVGGLAVAVDLGRTLGDSGDVAIPELAGGLGVAVDLSDMLADQTGPLPAAVDTSVTVGPARLRIVADVAEIRDEPT